MTHSGGKPHEVGDRGQRYEVTYFCPEDGKRKTFGWAATRQGADQFVRSIELHPTFEQSEIIDREKQP